MSATIFVATYPTRSEAEEAAQVAAEAVAGTEYLIVEADESGDALDKAIELRAARTALVGIVATMIFTLVVMTVMILLGTHETGTLLAIGLALTATAAPFAGGLGGFIVGLHRWTSAEVVKLNEPEEQSELSYLLAMRSTDTERLPEVLNVPAAA